MPSTGTPSSKTASGARGVPASCTEAGPPDRMIALGAKLAQPLGGHGEGMDLAIDAALAHAARDELRHLAAEIEDEDAVGHVSASSAAGAILRKRRLALEHRDEEPVGAVARRGEAQHRLARRVFLADRRAPHRRRRHQREIVVRSEESLDLRSRPPRAASSR